jgi:hypothetical protein
MLAERRTDYGGKRSIGRMEADSTIFGGIRAIDTGIQEPASGGRPYFLPKAPEGEKDGLRLGRRSETVVQAKGVTRFSRVVRLLEIQLVKTGPKPYDVKDHDTGVLKIGVKLEAEAFAGDKHRRCALGGIFSDSV